MPFQSKINQQMAPGVAGDFASLNPNASVLAGPGALVAPVGGLLVGNFCWVGPAGQVSQSYVAGYALGFVGKNEQALITIFLGEATMLIPYGFMVNAFNQGDFWAKFQGGATPGQTVYADKANGAVIAAASGSTPAAASATGLIGTTADVAGSITAGVLTISAAGTHGVTMPGDAFIATGVAAGTTIVAQLTGSTGGAGTYSTTNDTNPNQTVAAFTNGQVTFSSFIDFSAVGTGTLIPGDTLVSALLAPNTELGVQVTGTAGGAGIYNVSPAQANIASGTITTDGAVATQFLVAGAYTAGNGEVAKISSWA